MIFFSAFILLKSKIIITKCHRHGNTIIIRTKCQLNENKYLDIVSCVIRVRADLRNSVSLMRLKCSSFQINIKNSTNPQSDLEIFYKIKNCAKKKIESSFWIRESKTHFSVFLCIFVDVCIVRKLVELVCRCYLFLIENITTA